VLLGDVSGEWFRRLVDGEADLDDLSWLRRADRVVLTVDGALLARTPQRFVERQRTTQLVRILLESDLVSGPSYLTIVVTKWDTLVGAGSEAMDFTEQVVNRLLKAVDNAHGGTPRVIRAAARSGHPDVTAGQGIQQFLESCLISGADQIHTPPALRMALGPFERFDAES
jgi:hypothetical protein